MSKIGWTHPTDDSDQWDGFNEPGIEHFSGSPIRHLAREVVQNSLDSHDEEIAAPVKVVIKEATVKTADIPNLPELKRTFDLCLQSAEFESAKARQFFEFALSELAKPKIKVLEISDFNTKGIRGPVKNGSPYYAFMKAKGQSKKSNETAGGSFGIGKFAPYAVSKLRTVFVSTVFKDEEGNLSQYTQGKSILMSHDDELGQRHQGIGFWGVEEKCQPVSGTSQELPSWLVRARQKDKFKSAVGTKLVILGFDSQSGWQQSLAASIAENFFGAIHAGRLEVLIDEKYQINSSGMHEIFANDDIAKAIINEKNEPDQFENSRAYYECVVAHDNSFIEQHQNQNLGLCELKILVGEGMPKKVAFLRNGMFISDSLGMPGLKSFSEFKDFVAVFQCKDEKGISLLRAMEPPRHDDFEPDRLPTKDEQVKARRALKDAAAWIREMLRRRAKDPISEITKLDELKEFFADDSEDGKGNGIEEINPFGKIVLKAKPVSAKKYRGFGIENGDADAGTSADGSGGGGGEGGGGSADSEGGAGVTQHGVGGGGTSKPLVPVANPRAVITSANCRKLAFTPLSDGQLEISLFESGADSEYLVGVKTSSAGQVEKGKIQIKAQKGIRQILEVELGENFEGAIKVVTHEI